MNISSLGQKTQNTQPNLPRKLTVNLELPNRQDASSDRNNAVTNLRISNSMSDNNQNSESDEFQSSSEH